MVLATEDLRLELYQLTRKKPDLFNFLQESAPEGLLYLNLKAGNILYLNKKLQTTLGIKRSLTDNNFTTEQIFADFEQLEKKISAAQQDHFFTEIALRNSETNTLHFEAEIILVKDSEEKPERLLCGILQLKDNREQEIGLLKKVQRYEQIIEGTNIGTWEWNLQTGEAIFNEQWANTLGYTLEELQPTSPVTWSRFSHPGDMEKCQQLLEDHFRGKTDFYESEARMKHKNGNWVWVLDRGKVVSWTPDGRPEWMTGYHEEITKRKKAFEHNRLFIDQAPSAIAMFDNEMRYLAASQKWLEDYEIIDKNIIGKSHYEIFPEVSEEWKKIHRECLGGAVRKREEELFIKKDGTQQWLNWEMRPWFKMNQKIGGVIMHSTDITAKKETERINNEREAFLEAILESIDVGIISCDKDGQLTLFNKASKEWHGLPAVKIPQSELTNYYGLYKTDGVTPLGVCEIPLLKALKKGGVQQEEMVVRPKKGEERKISVTGSQLKTSSGKVAGAVVALHDITQRKKAEEKLRISEQAFRGNFENAAVGMAILNEKGKWLEVNKSLCNMLGYSAEELMQLTFQDITHQDDLNADLRLLKELVDGERSHYQMEKRYHHKNGQPVYVILSVSLVRDSKNAPLYFISQITDVTAQKTAEKSLMETLAKMESILDASSQVSIIGTDTRGKITVFNRGAENLLGYCREEMLANMVTNIHLPEEIKKFAKELAGKEKKEGFEVLAELAGKKQFDTREWTYVRKDGSQFPVQLTITAIKHKGEVIGYLGVAADISKIKKVEKEIKTLLEVTRDQNERLKNFAHIVSHNLRSHSGNLAMLLDLYTQENPGAAEDEMVRHLITASHNLKETIAHLNEVVLINTSVNDNLMSLHLSEVIDQSVKNVAALAEEAKVKILNETDPELEIKGLPAYVDSILLNFLTNGIKYSSPERQSYIKLSSHKRRKFAVLEIEDNGLGIDLKKYKSKLFGMYKTFHSHQDARGIGLFITKNQIEAIGGKIEVESEVNHGTTFKIYFKI